MPLEMMTKWAKRRHNGVKMLDSFVFFSNNLYICSANKYETNNIRVLAVMTIC